MFKMFMALMLAQLAFNAYCNEEEHAQLIKEIHSVNRGKEHKVDEKIQTLLKSQELLDKLSDDSVYVLYSNHSSLAFGFGCTTTERIHGQVYIGDTPWFGASADKINVYYLGKKVNESGKKRRFATSTLCPLIIQSDNMNTQNLGQLSRIIIFTKDGEQKQLSNYGTHPEWIKFSQEY